MERYLRSPEETHALGHDIGCAVQAGDVIALYGPVGAGKTVLAQGVLEGLGCRGPHPSPSFTLVRVYAGRLPVHHVDLYRLGDRAPAEDLGWDEILGGDSAAVVEWAEYLGEALPAERLDVHIEPLADGGRRVRLEGFGPGGRRLLRAAVATAC